jgi:hypothetical protein
MVDKKEILTMLRMGKFTEQSPQEVLAKANAFFGPGGTGLDIIPRGVNVVEFTGGGGFVVVQAEPKEGGTDIDIQTQEWDYDVKKFLQKF